MSLGNDTWRLTVVLRKGTTKIQKSKEIKIGELTLDELEGKLETLLRWLKPEVSKTTRKAK